MAKRTCYAAGRLRGSGHRVYNDKIYLVGGIQDGHYDGTVTWMDEFDLKPAPGAPCRCPPRRDHAHAVVIAINYILQQAGAHQPKQMRL